MRRSVIIGGLYLAMAGCEAPAPSDIADSEGQGSPFADCSPVTPRPEFDWIQDTILTPACTGSAACHQGQSDLEHLDLRAGRAYRALMEGVSEQRPDLLFVEPTAPERSYLMIKLGDFDQDRLVELLMPYGAPLLCAPERDAIAEWIAAGAPSGT